MGARQLECFRRQDPPHRPCICVPGYWLAGCCCAWAWAVLSVMSIAKRPLPANPAPAAGFRRTPDMEIQHQH
jgi:hypothetical protein